MSSSQAALNAFRLISIESNEINYAFAALLFYDYILCFAEEVEYFWTGLWSLSRVLYLAIRYFSLSFAVFSVILYRLTPQTTPPASWVSLLSVTLFFIKVFVFVIPISFFCQSVITLRIWYLFSRNLPIRTFAVATLIASTVASTLLLALQWDAIRTEILDPQLPSSSSFAWTYAYVPSLVSHSVFFALKVYRFFTSSVRMQPDSLLWGFVKEGMFMYVFAMVSLLFGVVGLAMTEPSQLSVHIPAAIASPIVAAVAVSVCRAMLSIRSVAATAHVDPEWLLNHAELSRVHWRRGNMEGEIIVEAPEEFTMSLNTKYPGVLPSPTARKW